MSEGAVARDDAHLDVDWWRAEEILGARLSDLVAGLDSIGSLAKLLHLRSPQMAAPGH
jgi:hypothetical protein